MTTVARACLRLVPTVLAAGLVAAALSACSAKAEKPDACKLVDPAAAGKILGTTLKLKKVDTSAAGKDAASLCNYFGGSIKNSFLVIAAPLDTSSVAAAIADQKKSIMTETMPPGIPAPKITDVSDLGDGAFVVELGPSLQLHVLAHGDSLVISRNVAMSPAALDETKQIARLAVAGLK